MKDKLFLSDITNRAYFYLSYKNIAQSEEVARLITECSDEISMADTFLFKYKKMIEPLEFMKSEPYSSYLKNSNGYYLICSTLGHEIDRKIKYYGKSDIIKSEIFDSVANAYIELSAESLKNQLTESYSYIFSPGYQGSDISDIRYILDELRGEEIGMVLTDNFSILPQKSIVGILATETTKQKECGNCAMLNSCIFRKSGKRCYN